MDLTELLESIRQMYVDDLAMALHEAKSEPDSRLISEAVLRNEENVPLREGKLNLPMRIDGVVVKGPDSFDSISVDSTKSVSGFADVQFEWPGGLAVSLNPFTWDSLRVYLPEGHSNMDWEPLLTWYEEWFRAEEDGEGDLLLVVHLLGDPEDVDTGTAFRVDLGSAPVGAVEELLDALGGLDVSRVVLGQPPAEE